MGRLSLHTAALQRGSSCDMKSPADLPQDSHSLSWRQWIGRPSQHVVTKVQPLVAVLLQRLPLHAAVHLISFN